MYTSRLYATALAFLGVFLIFSSGQFILGGGYFTSVPGAGGLLHVLNLFSIVMAPVGRLVIGVVSY